MVVALFATSVTPILGLRLVSPGFVPFVQSSLNIFSFVKGFRHPAKLVLLNQKLTCHLHINYND